MRLLAAFNAWVNGYATDNAGGDRAVTLLMKLGTLSLWYLDGGRQVISISISIFQRITNDSNPWHS